MDSVPSKQEVTSFYLDKKGVKKDSVDVEKPSV